MAELIRVRSLMRPRATVRVTDSLVPTLQIDTFIAAGTWARPTLDTFWSPSTRAANRVRVKLWAAGGGGTTNTGAGGGGAYAQTNDVDVSGAASFAVAGVAATGATANAADATFGASLVVAKGGMNAANGGLGGLATECVGEIKFSGGNGQQGAGTMTSGAGAGSVESGAAAVAGDWEGGAGSTAVGFMFGAGGGSAAAAQSASGRGNCQVEYFIQATAGYARFLSYALTRTVNGTAHVVTMPEGIVAGDLLIAIIGTDGTPTVSASAGWTALGDMLEANNAVRGTLWYRVATGVDALTLTTSAGTRVSGSCLRFAGAGTPEATLANGNGVNANCPSHTRTGGGGAAVKGIWIAAVVWDANAVMTISAPPSGFTNWVAMGALDASSCRHTFSMLLSEVSTVDPGIYSSTTEQWVACTILVPPA